MLSNLPRAEIQKNAKNWSSGAVFPEKHRKTDSRAHKNSSKVELCYWLISAVGYISSTVKHHSHITSCHEPMVMQNQWLHKINGHAEWLYSACGVDSCGQWQVDEGDWPRFFSKIASVGTCRAYTPWPMILPRWLFGPYCSIFSLTSYFHSAVVFYLCRDLHDVKSPKK